ncbi:MAG: YdbH domain-containing protein [Pseudomonadales bacterium]
MKKFILPLLVIPAALLAGAWLAFPAIVSALEPHLARELALDGLRIVAERPGWRGLKVPEVDAMVGGAQFRVRNAELSYRWRELLQGRLQSLDLEALQIQAEAPPAGSAAGSFSIPRLPFALSALPLERARVGRIELTAPHLDLQGEGRLEFAQARLSVSATARTPLASGPLHFELVLQTPADGDEVQLDLALLEAGSDPWVTAQAIERAGVIEITASYRLQGFALDRLSSLAGLPPGQGRLQGTVAGRLDLDGARQPDWSSLQAQGPLTLTWHSRDRSLLIDSLAADARYGNGELVALLGADISANLPDTQLRLRVPAGLQLTANPSRVDLAAGAQIDVRSGDLILQAQLQRFELPLGDIPAARLRAGINLLSPQVAEGILQADLSAPDGNLPSHRGDVSFNGTLRLEEEPLPLGLTGTYRLNSSTLAAELLLTSGPVQRLPLHLAYTLDGAVTTIRSAHSLSWSEPLIATLLPAWATDYDLHQGRMDMSLDLVLDKALTGSASFLIHTSTLHYADYVGNNTSAVLKVALTPDGVRLGESTLGIGSLDVGFPVTGIEATFSGSLERLLVERFQARLLGGQALAAPFEYRIENAAADISLTLTDLDLTAVLALEGEDISGDGRLDGQLPVRIRGGEVSVTGGRIDARAPGGTIHLAPSLANAIARPGLDLALRALQDFRFTTLSAGVDYAESGDLNLSLRLEGHNPGVEKGRPIHYNLNISENIPTLLESLRLSDSFTDSIQNRVIR